MGVKWCMSIRGDQWGEDVRARVEGRIAYHEANGKSEVNSLHVAAHMKELRMYCDGLSCFALLLTCSVPFWHCSFTDVQWAYSKDPAGYHSLSCSQTISAIEELIELTSSLAESIPQFQELSQNNVSAPDIAIHVRMDFKSLPEPNWSAEKTDAFYYNKLILVLDYLKCSGLVGLSPQSNEMKCINALLDYVTSVHLPVKKESEVCDPFYAYEPVGATYSELGSEEEVLYRASALIRTWSLLTPAEIREPLVTGSTTGLDGGPAI